MQQSLLFFFISLTCAFFLISPTSFASIELSQNEFDQLKAKIEALEINPNRLPNLVVSGFTSIGFISVKSDDSTGEFTGAQFSPAITYTSSNDVKMAAELYIAKQNNGETNTNLEYAIINVPLGNSINLIAGQFLSPIGQYRQALYSPVKNKFPTDPAGFGRESTIPRSETGIQLKGLGNLKKISLNYAIYFGNGPELEIETLDNGSILNPITTGINIKTINNQGFSHDLNDGKAFGGRLGIRSFCSLINSEDCELGFSFISGDADAAFEVFNGSNPSEIVSGISDIMTIGFDFFVPYQNSIFRGEYLKQNLDTLEAKNTTSPLIAPEAEWETYYLAASYRLNTSPWELAARYAHFSAPNDLENKISRTIGTNYYINKNTIAKLAYDFNSGHTKQTSGNAINIQLAIGF